MRARSQWSALVIGLFGQPGQLGRRTVSQLWGQPGVDHAAPQHRHQPRQRGRQLLSGHQLWRDPELTKETGRWVGLTGRILHPQHHQFLTGPAGSQQQCPPLSGQSLGQGRRGLQAVGAQQVGSQQPTRLVECRPLALLQSDQHNQPPLLALRLVHGGHRYTVAARSFFKGGVRWICCPRPGTRALLASAQPPAGSHVEQGHHRVQVTMRPQTRHPQRSAQARGPVATRHASDRRQVGVLNHRLSRQRPAEPPGRRLRQVSDSSGISTGLVATAISRPNRRRLVHYAITRLRNSRPSRRSPTASSPPSGVRSSLAACCLLVPARQPRPR